jgi:signal transduction histidine kinase/ActR/RegA family two-component response regulator
VDDLQIPFDPPENATADELKRRIRALAALVERAPVPIAVAHDAHCQFISANTALARLLGVRQGGNISLTPPEGENPSYRIQRAGQDMPADELPMQYAIAHRSHVTNDIEIIRADDTVVFVRNDVEPLYDARGAVCGCVSVCVDMTESRRVEEMLREVDRRKDEFLATLSHELRNPLAPIRNALELMRRAGDDRRLTEPALSIMERQFQQLVRLTDDLLDVSRITRNRLELRLETIDLRDVLRSAIETTQPLFDVAGHTLRVSLPPEPVWVDGDFTRLAQAFGNLLNNAAKYTNRGGVITLNAEAIGAEVVVTVADNGIGIAADELPRIFEMFIQSSQGSDHPRGGLGIGLTLAQRLLELHAGHIEARSPGRGSGTTFTTRLPRTALKRDEVEAELTDDSPVVACRILVAEDVPDAAQMLRLMLECMGHAVRVAADGVEAVRMALEFQPQIALLDIGMPRMDGYEAARRIRKAMGEQVILVAVTGWGQDEDKRRAREAGFDHHLTKPAEPKAVERLIATVASRGWDPQASRG